MCINKKSQKEREREREREKVVINIIESGCARREKIFYQVVTVKREK